MLMLEARMTYIAQQRQTVDKLNTEMEQKLIVVFFFVFFFNPVWKLTPLSQILLKIVCETESKALLPVHDSFGSVLEKWIFKTDRTCPFTLNGCLLFSDELKGGPAKELARGNTDSLAQEMPGWLCARKQNFPTCSPLRHISAGERSLILSKCLQCGAQPREYNPASLLHWARNASSTAAINQRQRLSLLLSFLSFFSLFYAHRHAGWGHSERVNRCRLIRPRLSDIAQLMYLMWSLFSSNKCIKN